MKDIRAAKCQACQAPFWHRFFVAENVLFCSTILLDILDKWEQIFIMGTSYISLVQKARPNPKGRRLNNELIPFNVPLPVVKANTEGLIEYFRILGENDDPMFQAWNISHTPVEVFAPDGTTVYINRAFMELNNIKDKSLLIGKYNLLQDPVCMDQLGYREDFESAFKGLKVITEGFPAPINDLVVRGVIEEKSYEAATMDLVFYPVRKKNLLLFVVCEFYVKNMYYGRPDVAKAKEYIDTHWQEDFDKINLAKAVNMSATQLYRVFSEHAGMTPGDYHNHVKIRHIKNKLDDPNLSIKEAFAQCGESSRGNMAKVFKETTGFSPSEYRRKFLS